MTASVANQDMQVETGTDGFFLLIDSARNTSIVNHCANLEVIGDVDVGVEIIRVRQARKGLKI